MSRKSAKIAGLIENCRRDGFDPHYLGYFECFNAGLYYEAHDVLEELWLGQRRGSNFAFYKGLIQFAGAFVHMQKHNDKYPRLRPAAALFKLARTNLQQYPSIHESLDVEKIIQLTDEWVDRLLISDFTVNPLIDTKPPVLQLI